MRKVLSKLAVAAAVLAGAASSAHAYIIISIGDFTGTTLNAGVSCNTFTDTVAACNALGFNVLSNNNVTFTGIVGDFDVAQASGVSNTPGNPLFAIDNSTTNTVTRSLASVGLRGLRITVDAIGFTMPAGDVKAITGAGSLTSNFGTAVGDSVTTLVTIDSSNGTSFTAPALPDALTALSCVLFLPTSNTSCPLVGPATFADPVAGVAGFSVRNAQQFNIAAGAFVSTTSVATITPVPEPMTTSLVGVALFGLALASRRRAIKKA